jgi:hypothetical protein
LAAILQPQADTHKGMNLWASSHYGQVLMASCPHLVAQPRSSTVAIAQLCTRLCVPPRQPMSRASLVEIVNRCRLVVGRDVSRRAAVVSLSGTRPTRASPWFDGKRHSSPSRGPSYCILLGWFQCSGMSLTRPRQWKCQAERDGPGGM